VRATRRRLIVSISSADIPPLWIATAHVDRREPVRDLRESHRPDLTLYKMLQEWHVLVASDSLPQGFERRVDNLAAAVTAARRPGS
jgi:hypothetical protein